MFDVAPRTLAFVPFRSLLRLRRERAPVRSTLNTRTGDAAGGARTPAGFVDAFRSFERALGGTLRRGAAHPLARLAVLGLAVRLVLAPFTSWTGDMWFYYRSVLDILAGTNPYHSMYYTYPPAWAWTYALPMLGLGAFVPPAGLATFVPSMVPVASRSLLVVPFVTSPAFNLVLKLPLILADLATGLLIYRLVAGLQGLPTAKRAFAMWFLNPLVILVGAVNGQFDVLPSLFLLLGVYFLVRREPAYAGIALSISVFYKIFAIYLLPAYLILLLRRGPDAAEPRSWARRPVALFGAGFLAASGLLALVFPWADGTAALLRRVSAPSYGGFTPLTLLGLTNPAGIGVALTIVGIVVPLVGISIVAILWERRTPSAVPDDLLVRLASANVVGIVILFAFTTLVNPQYFLWILPSMILLAYARRRSRGPVVALSGIGLAFILFLAGPLVFFYPAAVYVGWPSVAAINASVLNVWGATGAGGGPLGFQVILLLSLAGFVLLVLEAGSVWRELGRPVHG